MQGCAGVEQLRRLLDEQLGDAERDAVEAHVEGCPACQRGLAQLTGEGGGAADPRSARAAAPRPAPRHAPDSEFLHRLKQAPLWADDTAGGLLWASPFAARTAVVRPVLEGPGTVIGPYTLLQEIGEGGMGTVFLAEQTCPVWRRVALKVIKPGMDSRQVIARFEAERQALALMDHVNIARVLDAGATEAGRPYFVMELVHGVPITKYCDDNHLTPRERLELFVPVCQAIQHAHQKGIIHRDIKPSNVMVTLYDRKPVPKVIDFGVAKATEQKLTERTLFTQNGILVGTPEYMSPEQAEMSARGVDTRSDIYSLGVLLYELLTGSTPLSHRRLRDAGYGEILRMIKEEEPPRPSTRLSDSGAALASISAQRQMKPAKLMKLLRGELDWIVMKCLEKDRNRRYETVSSLARDVQRYLHDEPVQACPPSASYRLRKVLRRNKGRSLAVAVSLVLLVAGTVGTGIGLMHALDAENKAMAAMQQADDKARIAKAVNEFLLHDLLRQADSGAQADGGFTAEPDLTVREALNRAAAKIDHRFQDDPLVEAAIRHAIGDAYVGIGEAPRGLPHLQRSRSLRERHLGTDHAETLDAMNSLAGAYLAVNQLDQAIHLYELILAKRTEKLGPDHADTLTGMNNLAYALQYAGQLDRVLPLFEETLAKRQATLGPEHPDTLTSMSNLAWALQEAGQLDRALPLYEATLAKRQATLAPDHPETFTSMDYLAWGYVAVGKLDRGIALFKQSLAGRQAKQGPTHPETIACMSFLGVAFCQDGQAEQAVPLLEHALAQQRERRSPNHLETLQSMSYLAMAYQQTGEFNRAQNLFEETVAKQKVTLGADHLQTLSSLDNLAALHASMNRPDRAVPLFEECLKLRRAKLGVDHPHTLSTLAHLGAAYRDAGRLGEAMRCLEEALATARKAPGPLPTALVTILGDLAATYDCAGQFTKSEPLYREHLALCRKQFDVTDLRTAHALDLYGSSLLQQQRHAEAETKLSESLAIREKKRPDAWDTFHTRSKLGEALLGQKRYEDAESRFLAGFQGMKRREAKIPPNRKAHLTRTMERLVQLYEAWGKTAEATSWRKELHRAGP
jgi:serine/threonine protein kinase/tetratricopeptide (TPR) repeat protein